MAPTSELLDAVVAQRAVVAGLEAELAERRAHETEVLAELEGRLSSVRAGLAAAEAALRGAKERLPGKVEALRLTTLGLSRTRGVWVRIFEPLLLAFAVLFVPVGTGFTEGREWKAQLAAALGGAVLAQLARLVRG